MKCLIIIAGKGSRLKSLSESKPLASLLDVPLVERVIRSALEAGVDGFYTVVGYRGDQVRAFLEDLDGMNPFPDINENDSCNWLSGVVIENSSEMEIEDIKSLFRGASVQLMPFWKPLHLQPPFVEAPCQDLSVTEQLWTQIFALPCSTGITDEQLKIVADLLRSFSGTRSK